MSSEVSPDLPTRDATSLRDLMLIREAHRSTLQARPGYLGSAVGFKYSESNRRLTEGSPGGSCRFIPAILLFVDRKLGPDSGASLLATELTAQGIRCATDVVVGRPPVQANHLPDLSPESSRLRTVLREAGQGAFPGMPLSSTEGLGAVTCLVRSRQDPAVVGLLTAEHVAGRPGTVIERPLPRAARLGRTRHAIRERSASDHLGEPILSEGAFRLDAAFVQLSPGLPWEQGIDPISFAGDPPRLDLGSFDLLGEDVESVGPVRGLQRGQVVGFAYEWGIGHPRQFTDWLIVGEDGAVFAEPGDSGKLVVRSADRRPVALLWGGRPWIHSQSGHQETWCYASHLHSILEQLDLQIISPDSTTESFSPPLLPSTMSSPASLPASGLAGPDTLNLRYSGATNDVEVHYDGRLVIHSIKGENGAVRYLVSLFGGPCLIHTQRAQNVFVAAGRVVKQTALEAEPTDHKDNGRFEVPASSSCWLNAVEGFCQLLLTPVADPAFGGRDKERPILR